MNKNEALSLWESIKENSRKLKECKKHSFGSVIGNGVSTGYASPSARKRKCVNCGGLMEDQAVITYVRGFKAAGGNPDDIAKYVDGESVE